MYNSFNTYASYLGSPTKVMQWKVSFWYTLFIIITRVVQLMYQLGIRYISKRENLCTISRIDSIHNRIFSYQSEKFSGNDVSMQDVLDQQIVPFCTFCNFVQLSLKVWFSLNKVWANCHWLTHRLTNMSKL